MRNISHTSKSSVQGLEAAGKGLRREVKDLDGNKIPNPKYVSYHDNKVELKAAYQEYDNHTKPCKLEEITPMPLTPYQKDGLKELYGRERPFLKDLWDEVAYDNGEYIMCPLCGQKVVTDLDHYIPRAAMAEYSVHLLNLIPTCHECNDNKKDQWLDLNGKRIIFNAYFDLFNNMEQLLICALIINDNTNYPQVEISFDDSAIAVVGEIGRLVRSTYNHVENIREEWRSKATKSLKNQVRYIISSVNVRKRRGLYEDGDWSIEKETIQETIDSLQPFEFIEKIVYEKILDSQEFNEWIQKHMIY